MAIQKDLSIFVGDSDSWTGTVTDANSQPVDLTPYTVVFTLKTPSPLTKTLTKPGGVGVVQLGPLLRADTNGLASGSYPYDVVLVDGSGNHITAQYGNFTLVSHPNP